MRRSWPSYLVLVAIVVVPAAIYWIKPQKEAIYTLASVAILCGFLFIFFRYWSRIDAADNADSAHLRRQIAIVMWFILAGIASTLHTIAANYIQYGLVAEVLSLFTWGFYGLGIFYLVRGMAKLLCKG
jgi:hypothetical protein